jgi:hypothetical protein
MFEAPGVESTQSRIPRRRSFLLYEAFRRRQAAGHRSYDVGKRCCCEWTGVSHGDRGDLMSHIEFFASFERGREPAPCLDVERWIRRLEKAVEALCVSQRWSLRPLNYAGVWQLGPCRLCSTLDVRKYGQLVALGEPTRPLICNPRLANVARAQSGRNEKDPKHSWTISEGRVPERHVHDDRACCRCRG